MEENSILAELVSDGARGALDYRGVRYLLIRPETLASLQAALVEEIGAARAGELLYGSGFTGGQLSGRRYQELFGLDARGAVAFMCRMGGEIGWGRFELVVLDEAAGRLVVEVTASPFAESYAAGFGGTAQEGAAIGGSGQGRTADASGGGAASKGGAAAAGGGADAPEGSAEGGVCHLIRGVLGGLASVVFGSAEGGAVVWAREKHCLAWGDSVCRFEVEVLPSEEEEQRAGRLKRDIKKRVKLRLRN